MEEEKEGEDRGEGEWEDEGDGDWEGAWRAAERARCRLIGSPASGFPGKLCVTKTLDWREITGPSTILLGSCFSFC